MRVDILTLFPGAFEGPLNQSMMRRAIERGIVSVAIHDIREHGLGRHRQVDDYPYGGGAGMVLRPEPLFAAVEAVLAQVGEGKPPIVLLTPQGRLFTQALARELAARPWLVLICGHYEGVDERVREHLVTDEISIGDYVLTGGELPALVVLDAVVRLLPGVLGSAESLASDSHANGLLEHPHYTRPAVFRGWEVPPVLLSGNHAEIAKWRREQALLRTAKRRPDLLPR